MRHIVYFSASGATSGNFGDLMKAGRMDIAIHTVIQALFLSHDFRKDTKIHLILYGMPDPPKHIEIQVKDELEISKKDIGTLIKKILYKYKPGEKKEVLPGCFIEKKSFLKVLEEALDQPQRDNHRDAHHGWHTKTISYHWKFRPEKSGLYQLTFKKYYYSNSTLRNLDGSSPWKDPIQEINFTILVQ